MGEDGGGAGDGAAVRAVERVAHRRGSDRSHTALCDLLQLGDEEVSIGFIAPSVVLATRRRSKRTCCSAAASCLRLRTRCCSTHERCSTDFEGLAEGATRRVQRGYSRRHRPDLAGGAHRAGGAVSTAFPWVTRCSPNTERFTRVLQSWPPWRAPPWRAGNGSGSPTAAWPAPEPGLAALRRPWGHHRRAEIAKSSGSAASLAVGTAGAPFKKASRSTSHSETHQT